MKVVKTTITLTILRDAEMYPTPLTEYELAGLAEEIMEGPFLGSWTITDEQEVPPEKLRDEQLALGNDGTFFETEETDPFAGQFMQPYVQHGEYFEVETTHGTEIVPADVVGRTTETVHVEFLLNYLEGKPTNEDEELPRKTGWLARMSAPGYMDCTSWEAHPTEAEARQSLIDQYGNE